MSHTSWSTSPAMGSAPPYHLDPSQGGLPVFSPDGRWRWAGDHWELREDPDDAEDDAEAVAELDQSASDPESDDGGAASLD